MDERRKKELARLLEDVEATRSSLSMLSAGKQTSSTKSGPGRTYLIFGISIVLIIAALGVWLSSRCRKSCDAKRHNRRGGNRAEQGKHSDSFFAAKESPSRKSDNQLLQIVAKSVVELLKPAVTQILTRKATTSITRTVASAILKPIFGNQKRH